MSQIVQKMDEEQRENSRLDSSPKVSILIISYNQKDFISEAISSALRQDYQNLEVVISDDGSIDGTDKIIMEWQNRHPDKIKALIHTVNEGITVNLNKGLRACTGDLVALQGGDDVLLPGKITAQVQWFNCNPKRVLCGHQVEVFYEDDLGAGPHLAKSKLKFGTGPLDLITNGVPFAGTSIMVRAACIPAGGFNERIRVASDLLFYIEVLMDGGEYGYVVGTYARYRRHKNSVSLKRMDMLADVEKTYLYIADQYPQYREACKDSIVRHVIYYAGVLKLRAGDRRSARSSFLSAIKAKPLYLKSWIRFFGCIIS